MNSKRVVSTDPSAPVPQDVIGILESVIEERDRAMGIFGVQSHPDGTGLNGAAKILADAAREETERAAKDGTLTWRHILMEEVREAFAETDLDRLDTELCQVQQVCLVWREHIARRKALAEGRRIEIAVAPGTVSPEAASILMGGAGGNAAEV